MAQKSIQEHIWDIKIAFPKLRKNKQGFKFKYTDLKTIAKNLIPLITERNLAYRHYTVVVDGKNVLRTVLFQLGTGESEVSELVIPDSPKLAGMNDYQALGSGLTYFRRYNLITMFGLLIDEDVDALTPKQNEPPKVNHLKKIKQLIEIGKPKSTIEKYVSTYAKDLQPQMAEIKTLIAQMK